MTVKANNTICSKENPPEMTAEQVAECKFGNGGLGCRFASGRKLFCSRCGIGLEVSEKKIIQPSKQIIQVNKEIQSAPKKTQTKPCDEKDFEEDYEAEKSRYDNYILSGNEILDFVSKEEYVRRRAECAVCPKRRGCVMGGCAHREKLLHRKNVCPKKMPEK